MSLKKQYSKSKPVCKVTFNLPKEATNGGKKVLILGDFNNWNVSKGLKMKAGKNGFTASIELETGKDYEFRYLIDKINWTNDWDADAYRPSPYYGIDNSVLFLRTEKKEKKAAKPKKASAKKETTKKTSSKKKVSLKAAEKKASTKKAPVKKAAPKKVVKKAPAKKVTKRVVADDLKKIEGVGPKIAELLKKGGFPTFAAVGKAKKTELKAILDAAGKRYQMHDPTTWAKQAKLAAAGKWDQLKKLQDVLKGGK